MVKNILFLAPFPPHKGGIAYYSSQFLKEAPESFKIIPIGFKNIFPKFLYPGSSIKKRENNSNFQLKIDVLNPFSWSYLKDIKLEEEGILLIPYWTSILSLPFYFIVRSFKKKYKSWKFLLWCHNVKDHKKFFFLENFKKVLFKKADGLIVHSSSALNEVSKFYKKPVLLSFLPLHPLPYNLIEKNEAKKSLGLEGEDKTILFFGTIRKYKGVEKLIEIKEILKDKDFKFIVAGDLWRECKKYLKDFKKLNFKTFFGFLEESEVIKFFSSADLILMPYEKASGSGILMMCYTFEVPFCISYLEELKDYLPEGYPILNEAKDFSEFIIKFFEDKFFKEEIIKKIEKKKNDFTWEKFFKRFEKFLENML